MTAARPLRVVQIVTWLDAGGAQETVLATAEGVAGRDDVEVITLAGTDDPTGGLLWRRAERSGLDVRPVPELHRAVRPLDDLRARTSLARTISALDADVVHTHSSKAGVLGRLAAGAAGVPAVHTVHGWSFHRGQPALARHAVIALERFLAARTERLVVVTGVDREIGLAAGIGSPGRYTTVRSAIDIDAIGVRAADRDRARAELGVTASAFVMGSVTRLAAQKDPETLVRAFAAVAGRVPEAVLVVVGDGPLAAETDALVATLGLTDRVVLTGARDDATALLGAFDVFVSPARWEGLPRTVLEAAVAGVPIVATPVGGVGEVVEHGRTGLLVEPGDVDGVADAVLAVHDDREYGSRLAALARSRVGCEFDVTTMVDRLVALWHEVAGRQTRVTELRRAS